MLPTRLFLYNLAWVGLLIIWMHMLCLNVAVIGMNEERLDLVVNNSENLISTEEIYLLESFYNDVRS